MNTECTPDQLNLHGLAALKFAPCRKCYVVAQINGSYISSDGGAVLLTEVENRTHIVHELSQCFNDYRKPEWIEHSVEELLRQRIYGLALGYEDLNDHDELRHDPLFATVVGKEGPQWRRSIRSTGLW